MRKCFQVLGDSMSIDWDAWMFLKVLLIFWTSKAYYAYVRWFGTFLYKQREIPFIEAVYTDYVKLLVYPVTSDWRLYVRIDIN